MHLLRVLECGLLGTTVVLIVIPFVLRFAQSPIFFRAQEFHHTHVTPVPRLGGLALALAFLSVEFAVAMLFREQRALIPGRRVVILTSFFMFAIGFWDDLKPLGAKRKFFAQVAVALCVHYSGLGVESLKLPFSDRILELGQFGVLVTVFWLVGITNLLNLIDGVDGVAGGIGLMLMALLVYVGYQNGTFVLLTAGMAGALIAFLWFNFPPARIYLGDGGAYLIGYQVAIFSLVSSHKGTVIAALLAPLFVLAWPILDTVLAILRRSLYGLPLSRPDRRHIHHRLLAAGLSRRQVVLLAYGITLMFLVMAFLICWSRGQYVPVLFGLLALILFVCAGRLSFRREWFTVGRTLGNYLSIRRDVRYAMSLGRLLKHEGSRCASVDDLFADFVLAASRLGFNSVSLQLADGVRNWTSDHSCSRTRRLNQKLLAGKAGELQLSAPICMRGHACSRKVAGVRAENETCLREPDQRKFEILSDLLAEGWLHAITQYAGDIRGPMSFAMPPRGPSSEIRRRGTLLRSPRRQPPSVIGRGSL